MGEAEYEAIKKRAKDLFDAHPGTSQRQACRILGVPIGNRDLIRRIKADLGVKEGDFQEGAAATRNKRLERELEEAQRIQKLFVEASEHEFKIPTWVRKPHSKKRRVVMPVLQFSDQHYGEVVKPEAVRFLNGYNVKIAEQRTKNTFERTCILLKEYMKGIEYDGIVVAMLGDNVSGDIHEELKETNEQTMLETLLHFVPQVAAGLKLLRSEFGRVYVPCVVGNHGRNQKKPRHKLKVENNFDWLFSEMLRRELQDEPDIEMHVSKASDYQFNVYSTRFLASHGDEARGGSGIQGALAPLMIADARKRKTYEYDYWICGHWHQLLTFKRIFCNSSVKGYDEFAKDCNYEHAWPEQNLFLVDPHYGVTGNWPVRCIDKSEAWIAESPRKVPGFMDGGDPFRRSA